MSVRLAVNLLMLLAGFACADRAKASELAGTSWHLVTITSMDDSVDVPDDRSKYTLDLRTGGNASIGADCNRGMGTWTAEAAGQLQFGPVASTRAMCPPGSLSDKYLAQFEWVRSYVMKNGHLFLATMADGAIIEFEPGDPSAATVLGQELRMSDAGELQDAILTRLFDQYAADRGISAETAEIDAFLKILRHGKAAEGLTAEDDLTPEEAAEVEAMETTMTTGLIRQWKINKALYEQYGGRIIYQQFGPEPLDAYRQFLRLRQEGGTFTIHDPAMAERFWAYFTDESIHDFMEPGSTEEARAFSVPPWEAAQYNGGMSTVSRLCRTGLDRCRSSFGTLPSWGTWATDCIEPGAGGRVP